MRLSCNTSNSLRPCAGHAAIYVAALACVLFACSPLRAQEAKSEGQRVAEIRIVDESRKVVVRDMASFPLHVGDSFDIAKERDALRELYRTGDFSDIDVRARPTAEGLQLEFLARRNYFNNAIRIEGLKEPPSEPAAQAALRLTLGEPFRESALQEAIDRLKDSLHNEGLFQAKVTWALTPHQDTRQMDVTITVVPGPRAVIGSFAVQNKTPYPDYELIRRSKIKLKNQLTTARLAKASERLKKYLVNQGFLGAGVLITPGPLRSAIKRRAFEI